MTFTLGFFMPKPMFKLPTFQTYPQPRKSIIVCGNPERPKGSTGNGGKTNSEKQALNSAQILIKETEKNKPTKEDSSAENKSKASN